MPDSLELSAPAPLTVPSSAPFLIVMNAGSGHDDAAELRAAIERKLGAAGREHRLALVEEPARLPEIARAAVAEAKARGGVVVVAGGDGTINAVANAHYGSGLPFGVLPQGTFNYFGRVHGLPLETEQALDMLLGARAHPVQLGLVNDRVFLVNASLGLYPEILEDREGYKRRLGRNRWVAIVAALSTLLHARRQLEIDVEYKGVARRQRTLTLFVGNNELQLERLGIPEAPALEHGRLVGIMLRPVGLLELLGLGLRGALGKLGEADEVVSFAFAEITVEPQRRGRVKVAADGEVWWLTPPLTFKVAPEPLYLLKPEPQARA